MFPAHVVFLLVIIPAVGLQAVVSGSCLSSKQYMRLVTYQQNGLLRDLQILYIHPATPIIK